MDIYTATEQAYKRGYEKGYAAGKRDATDNNVGHKWIPVTERLPELFESCFVVVKLKYDWEEDYEYGVDSGYYLGENGYIDGFNTFNDWNEGQEHLHVTHWMPLPEAPKED